MASNKIHITTVIDQNFGENAYIVWLRDEGPCWIIDPGLPPAPIKILAHLEKHKLKPESLVLTHGHLDHIGGMPMIMEALPDLPIHIANEAKPALTDPGENLSQSYGVPLVVGDYPTIDLPVDGELVLSGTTWRVLETSGHAPGSRSFYCEKAGLVIVGDALFQGSIGRTDFHHSNGPQLIANIRDNLLTLPEETIVYSGHGPTTTIGIEKQTNPFLQENSPAIFDDMY